LKGYDEPEILRYQLSQFGPISADAGQPIFNSAGKVAYILNSMGISTAMAPIERQVAEQMITTISEIHELIGSNAPASFPTAQPSMS
jgi:hypothetical protein